MSNMSNIQMPGKSEDEEGDEQSWTQTLITITPEEDAAIRTISGTTVISAARDTPFVLRVDQIGERRTVQFNTMRQDSFIDTAELEERISRSDAECQTFLQGVPKVELPSVLKDEATQTMYLGKICPYNPQSFQDVTRIMNDRIMPGAEKVTEMTQSVVTFEPDAPRNYIVERLTSEITADELRANDSSYEQATAVSTYVKDSLHFILDRVLWLTEPGDCVPKVKLKDEVVQTFIKYDYRLGKVVLDADTQTSLTCEPRRSNTGLLTEWSAIKEFAHDMIDECLEIGIHPRIIAHSILDEVVERCASQIHLPFEDKTMQTLAPCNALNDGDDEVLRKLRIEIVLDTLESSIIVLPLIEILVERTCMDIRQDASTVAAEILDRIQKNSVTIATRLAAIRREAVSHKPMDDIFDARKKRLRELLQNKTAVKLSSSAQTELAGVPDVMKVKEPRETVCSTCLQQSECYNCDASLDDEELDPENTKRENIVQGKILRTQDILIAYNPCYVVATTRSEIPEIQPPIVPRRLPVAPVASEQPKRLSRANISASASDSTSFDRRWLDDVCPPGQKSAKLKEKGEAIHTQSRTPATGSSLNDWARVAQDTSSISGLWSIHGSSSSNSSTIRRQVGASSTCLSRKPPHMECAGSRCDVFVRSVKALRILKKTFNRNEESCSDCSYDREKIDVKLSEQRSGAVATGSTSSDKEREKSADQQTSRGPGFHGNSYGERVRVVPIVQLPNQINRK